VLVFVAIVLGAFWGVWNAAAQSLLSRAIDPSEQGRLQGALASLRALCQVLTPALFNGAFAAGVSAAGARLAGAPMLLSALLLALALPFAIAAARTPAAPPRS
jgi:DHA1 family tetracycline resistance protein-like MFS transporter